MKRRGYHFAIVGARSAIGREIAAILEERQASVERLSLFGTERSIGETGEFRGKEILVEALHANAFKDADIVIFAGGAQTAKRSAADAVNAGAVVIDCSGWARTEEAALLVVPEVNGHEFRTALREAKGGLAVGNPSASAIQLAVVLEPILKRAGLKRVVLSTYESVSGAGQKGINELSGQVRALFNQKTAETSVFPSQIAFNCIPQIGSFMEDGRTSEEAGVVSECRRVLQCPDLKLSCTSVRVAAFHCLAQSVNVETEKPLSAAEAKELLRSSPGIVVTDNEEESEYPTNYAVAGSDAVHAGRIRADQSIPNGLNLWIVADNMRKGAALNAVQIAEISLSERRLT